MNRRSLFKGGLALAIVGVVGRGVPAKAREAEMITADAPLTLQDMKNAFKLLDDANRLPPLLGTTQINLCEPFDPVCQTYGGQSMISIWNALDNHDHAPLNTLTMSTTRSIRVGALDA